MYIGTYIRMYINTYVSVYVRMYVYIHTPYTHLYQCLMVSLHVLHLLPVVGLHLVQMTLVCLLLSGVT